MHVHEERSVGLSVHMNDVREVGQNEERSIQKDRESGLQGQTSWDYIVIH